jgi:transposase
MAVGLDVGSSAMMRPVGEVKVYLHREPIDMRKGRNGLAALVREGMRHCMCSSAVAMTR